jgi:hypothetical protein
MKRRTVWVALWVLAVLLFSSSASGATSQHSPRAPRLTSAHAGKPHHKQKHKNLGKPTATPTPLRTITSTPVESTVTQTTSTATATNTAVPPTQTNTPPPASGTAVPDTATPAPSPTCLPGNGFGDKNHCHSGPPGHK